MNKNTQNHYGNQFGEGKGITYNQNIENCEIYLSEIYMFLWDSSYHWYDTKETTISWSTDTTILSYIMLTQLVKNSNTL